MDISGNLPCSIVGQDVFANVPVQILAVPFYHGDGCPQVMGNAGVDLLPFIHQSPHPAVIIQQLPPHFFKRTTKLAQFILLLIAYGKRQIVVRNVNDALFERVQRFFQLIR